MPLFFWHPSSTKILHLYFFYRQFIFCSTRLGSTSNVFLLLLLNKLEIFSSICPVYLVLSTICPVPSLPRPLYNLSSAQSTSSSLKSVQSTSSSLQSAQSTSSSLQFACLPSPLYNLHTLPRPLYNVSSLYRTLFRLSVFLVLSTPTCVVYIYIPTLPHENNGKLKISRHCHLKTETV